MIQFKKDKAPLFYQLTNEEWVETVRNLTGAEIKVLYYLRSLDPFGDRLLDCSVTQTGEKLGLSKGAVSKALKKLDSFNLIDVELTNVKVRIKTSKNNVTELPTGNQVSYKKQELPIGNQDLPEETLVSYEKPELPIGNEQQPEPVPVKDSRPPHTNKTYKDFKDSLSEDERASFLNFCQEKIKNLSQEVQDIEAWLAHKNKAGQDRWSVYYQKFVAATQKEKEQKSTFSRGRQAKEEFERELEEQRLRAEKAEQIAAEEELEEKSPVYEGSKITQKFKQQLESCRQRVEERRKRSHG
jgi:hypothetical protein